MDAIAEFCGLTAPVEMWQALLPGTYGYSNDPRLGGTGYRAAECTRALIERAKDQLPEGASDEQILRRAIVLQAKDRSVSAINDLARALTNGRMQHTHLHAVEIGESLRTTLAQLAA